MHAKVRLVYKFWFSRIIRKLWLVFFFLLSISRIIYIETHFLENIFLLNYTHIKLFVIWWWISTKWTQWILEIDDVTTVMVVDAHVEYH
jgi:hypothetical protein